MGPDLWASGTGECVENDRAGSHVVESPPVTKRARLHEGEGYSRFHSFFIQERLKTANWFLSPSSSSHRYPLPTFSDD